MPNGKEIGRFIQIFNKIKDVFPSSREKYFRFNICMDAIVIFCVFIETIGSAVTHLFYAISSVLKTWILNTNISEYYNEPSVVVSIIIPIALCILCFTFTILYDGIKKRGYHKD